MSEWAFCCFAVATAAETGNGAPAKGLMHTFCLPPQMRDERKKKLRFPASKR